MNHVIISSHNSLHQSSHESFHKSSHESLHDSSHEVCMLKVYMEVCTKVHESLQEYHAYIEVCIYVDQSLQLTSQQFAAEVAKRAAFKANVYRLK